MPKYIYIRVCSRFREYKRQACIINNTCLYIEKPSYLHSASSGRLIHKILSTEANNLIRHFRRYYDVCKNIILQLPGKWHLAPLNFLPIAIETPSLINYFTRSFVKFLFFILPLLFNKLIIRLSRSISFQLVFNDRMELDHVTGFPLL